MIPWRARPASSSPVVRGWAVASAALSPAVMIGGWLAAEALQPPSYSPVRSTISGLAGLGGTGRWIMTSALFVVGACYFVTAAGLPGVRVPARIVLVVAGLSSIGIAVSPEPVRGSTPQHLAWTSLGAVAITVWPAFTARRAPSQPLILRARGAGAVTAVFLALLAWVVFETQGGTALGLAERLVSAVQVTWPFVVALALRRAVGQAAPSALRRAAAGGTQAGSWGDVFVDGGAAGAEQPGDGGDGVVRPGQQVAGGADLLGGHGRRPPHSAGAAHPPAGTLKRNIVVQETRRCSGADGSVLIGTPTPAASGQLAAYGNEESVRRPLLRDSRVPRDEVFITHRERIAENARIFDYALSGRTWPS